MVLRACLFVCTWVRANQQPAHSLALAPVAGLKPRAPTFVRADNCKVYPHFEAEYNGEMIDMCATVDQWKGNKGNKEITEKMETALFGLAHRYGCANKVVWENCYTMEEEFGRMLASDANC